MQNLGWGALVRNSYHAPCSPHLRPHRSQIIYLPHHPISSFILIMLLKNVFRFSVAQEGRLFLVSHTYVSDMYYKRSNPNI